MSQFKYFADISEETLNESAVIPCRNEDGFPCILIKTDSRKPVSSYYSTDNLSIKLDKTLSKGDKDYCVHIVESKRQDKLATMRFQTIYEYIFEKIAHPIDSDELLGLVSSLEQYFSLTPDPDRTKLQIGVFGELLSLCFLKEAGFPEVLSKYHSDFFLKHDIELSPSVRVEIKTAVGDKRIHHFRHDQLYRHDIEVFVLSVLLEPSQEGLTLLELFNRVLAMADGPDRKFALCKLMARCGVSEEDPGLSFSEELAFSRIRIFKAESLPKIEAETPKGVSAVQYDVDCSLAEELPVNEAIALLKIAAK